MSVGPKPAKEAAADAREDAQATGSGQAAFVPEKEFKGLRDGYIFQSGAQGLGYYLDRYFSAFVRLTCRKCSLSASWQYEGLYIL